MIYITHILSILLLVFASYKDIKTRIISNYIPIIIGILGIFNLVYYSSSLFYSLIAFSIFFITFTLLAMGGTFGAGDWKILISLSLFFNFYSINHIIFSFGFFTFISSIITLIYIPTYKYIYRKNKKLKKSIPCIPLILIIYILLLLSGIN